MIPDPAALKEARLHLVAVERCRSGAGVAGIMWNGMVLPQAHAGVLCGGCRWITLSQVIGKHRNNSLTVPCRRAEGSHHDQSLPA